MIVGFWGVPINVQSVLTNPMDTDVSTRDTIQRMIQIAKVSSQSPKVIEILDSLIRDLPRNPTQTDLARKVYWWIKNHVKFEEDESILANQLGYADPNQELLIPADTLLSMPQPMGDCDDFSMLAASFMVAAKIPVWFVAVAVDETEPWRFSHVYCAVLVDNAVVPFDASHGSHLGWETKRHVFRREEWLVN